LIEKSLEGRKVRYDIYIVLSSSYNGDRKCVEKLFPLVNKTNIETIFCRLYNKL